MSSIFVFLVGAGLIIAYTTDGSGVPSIMGHSLNEIDVPAGCVDGQVLQLSGGVWSCQTAVGGGGISGCTVRQSGPTATASLSVSCVGSEIRTGGGCYEPIAGSSLIITGYPSGTNSWTCYDGSSSWGTLTAYVVCCT